MTIPPGTKGFANMCAQTSWRGAFLSLHMAGCDHLRVAKEKILELPCDASTFLEWIRGVKSTSWVFEDYWLDHSLELAHSVVTPGAHAVWMANAGESPGRAKGAAGNESL
ncbi:hypothetical protein SEVIR_4G184852v4 [Setaria viridis]